MNHRRSVPQTRNPAAANATACGQIHAMTGPQECSSQRSASGQDSESSLFGIPVQDLYNALLTRDRRFDGRMFIGVSSTKIYCRPICTVRPPHLKNCTFYLTAAAAESVGLRPCLRCRPELAPGSAAPVDAVPRLAALSIRRIEDGALATQSLDELAADFGVSSRHLRRAIRQEAGLTPIQLAQTQRLLAAKQLLTDTRMPITDVAFAAGFESLRRFNTAFKEHYRLTPTSLRKSGKSTDSDLQDFYHFDLAVRPPFAWEQFVTFWQPRAIPGVEQVTDGWYRRTVVFHERSGSIAVGSGIKPHTIRVFVSIGLGPVLSSVLSRIKAMVDVRADTVAIADRLSDDPLLSPLFNQLPAPRVPGAFDGFECGVRAIVGQQISVRAATTVTGRIASRFGQTITTPFDGLSTTFPSSETLASASIADLQALGLTKRRAETVNCFARAIADGKLRLDPGADPDRARSGLLAVPGIGDWTAEYLLLRAVNWPDAFPASDLGLVKASGLSPTKLRARAESWRPWRSYAALLLWKSLGGQSDGRVKSR